MKTTISTLIILTLLSLSVFAQDFPFTTLDGHSHRVTEIVFSPDGSLIASASDGRNIRIWDVATNSQKHILTGHRGAIYSVAFSPDGTALASGDSEGKIRLWDATTGQYRVTLEGHQSGVNSVAFSADGQTLASGSSDRTIRLWYATTGLYRVTLEGHSEGINSVVFSPDGETLASGSSDRAIRLWNATTGFHQQTLTGHTRTVYDLLYIEEGQTLASMSDDNTIRLWDASTGQHQETLTVSNFRKVAISLDQRLYAGVDWNNRISLWDIATESEVASLTGHTSEIYSVTFSPDGKILASGGSDRIIRLWKLSNLVNITPSTVEAPAVGENFEIDINIVGGEDIRGYKITVEYESDSLQYVSHTHSEYLSDEVYEGPTVSNQGYVSFSIVSTAEAGNGDSTLATITFEVVSRRASTISLSATLSNSDGNRLPYIVISGKVVEPPWDANGDGSVDILDLSYVAARFGQEDQTEADVNRDGVVDIKDLIIVASGMDTEAASPSAVNRHSGLIPTSANVHQWILQAKQLNLTDPTSQKGILFLEYLLASYTPKATALLPNYPNPFNPETWIPFQLAKPSDVTLTIYAVDGTVIRTFNIGHKTSGIYQDKTRAIYWDGKNKVGEPIASGVYFYTLTAGKYTATRKMFICK